ncbi:hypothetical protein GTW66_18075 [Streptomyces sp. SID5473]|uniref:hypothetical protein n=1 Tax=Streptomyces sp. SID5473 TaxID=2690299 RepID=UPI00131C8AD0|nr:hypothetical protein [Streptomyces sp. SID5473]MYS65875.1 hypothetical protein [Streptomyces sp. SID5473]
MDGGLELSLPVGPGLGDCGGVPLVVGPGDVVGLPLFDGFGDVGGVDRVGRGSSGDGESDGRAVSRPVSRDAEGDGEGDRPGDAVRDGSRVGSPITGFCGGAGSPVVAPSSRRSSSGAESPGSTRVPGGSTSSDAGANVRTVPRTATSTAPAPAATRLRRALPSSGAPRRRRGSFCGYGTAARASGTVRGSEMAATLAS